MKEINEKNEKLLKLKIATGKIVTKLTKEKKNLKKEEETGKNLALEIEEKEKNIKKTNEDIKKI